MNSLQRVATKSQLYIFASAIAKSSLSRGLSSARDGNGGDDKNWNDAWETAWLPEDAAAKSPLPWESDVNFSLGGDDAEARAFMEDMNDNWNERRGVCAKKKEKKSQAAEKTEEKESESLYSLERMKKDYRLKKQKIHAALWTKEIEKQEEARLAGDGGSGAGDDIEKLLDRCSDIFDTANDEIDEERFARSSSYSSEEFKAKPDGWETTSKSDDGSVWEMSQREEDILLQEFERRIAYSKFQIASFIKTHIFSRRRPIDGWKYMIEEIGPNARKGKGSVSRQPTLSDSSTQPFKEEKTPLASNSLEPFRRR